MLEADAGLLAFVKSMLSVAVVCDMLDQVGHRHQAMHSRLRPLLPHPKSCGFVGRARTLRWMETEDIMGDPYGQEIAAIDSLTSGDVVVHSTDNSGTLSPWGELMATAAMSRGAVGCVCDANIRDCTKLIDMGFPVYYAGIRPLDTKGRGIVVAFDVPIRSGEVLVHPGDLVFADFDGIVVVPKDVERDVLELAVEKVAKENLTRKDLQAGASLQATYAKHGVL